MALWRSWVAPLINKEKKGGSSLGSHPIDDDPDNPAHSLFACSCYHPANGSICSRRL